MIAGCNRVVILHVFSRPIKVSRMISDYLEKLTDGFFSRTSSLHFSPPFVARRSKGVAWVAFATEERAGIVDTLSSTPTEGVPLGRRSRRVVRNAG